ncbi:MAG: hypothetical protein JKY54_12265 [Flavobacteriales bacterium]|nr:hypothetical protein [Flavobacteriales bacterium]
MSQLKSPYLKGTLIIGVLVMHFTITYFYTAPAPLNVPELEEASGNYMKPFFHQHWNLFAPEPPALNVVVSVSLDQGSTWNNLSEEILNNHYTWRITHHGRMALAFGNAALYAADEWQIAVTIDDANEITKSRNFLKETCLKYLQLPSNTNILVKMEIESIKTKVQNEVIY